MPSTWNCNNKFIYFLFLLVLSQQIVEVVQQYDNICPTTGALCNISITIPSKMTNPVQMYYQLENFYQNDRIYMKNFDSTQLAGSDVSAGSLSDCDPAIYMSNIGNSSIYYFRVFN